MTDFLKISLLLIVPFLHSCSSMQVANRTNKDLFLNEIDYMKLKGTYTDSTIVDYQRIDDTTKYVYAPRRVILDPLTSKKIKYTCFVNDSLISEKVLKGRFKTGYFIQKTNYVIEFVFGPLLWGPGSENRALGITKENNLVVLDAHGGIAFFLVVPFFGSGGNSQNVYKRIN